MTINPQYLESIKIEVYTTDWIDITADVVGDISVNYGIPGIGITDRVASTGTMEFTLRNDASCLGGVLGYYSPLNANHMAGFTTGSPVRLVLTLDSPQVVKFYGHIFNIKPESGTWGDRHVKVTVLDYMDYLARHPVTLPTLAFNKSMEEVVALIIAMLPVQPLHVQYSNDGDVYPFVFDTVNQNTFALSEINKVALSELGYVYIKRDWVDGETLVVEDRHVRGETTDLPIIPEAVAGSYFLALEDGELLLQENGEPIAIESFDYIVNDNNMTSLDADYGSNLINKMTTRAYPRTVDTSNQVLFTLTRTEQIAGYDIKTIKGRYADPNMKAIKVAGKDMIPPVATTDYLMYSTSSGVGDITSYLRFIDSDGVFTGTPIYGATDVQYMILNTYPSPGWITKLQARGLGIYTYEPVEFPVEDAASEEFHGYVAQTLDMKYQDNLDIAKNAATLLMYQNREPRTDIKEVSFLANTDDTLMRGFLYLDIGDLVEIKETQTGIDGYYYIQSIRFTIYQGGIIEYTWTVKQRILLHETFWVLETNALDVDTVLGVVF